MCCLCCERLFWSHLSSNIRTKRHHLYFFLQAYIHPQSLSSIISACYASPRHSSESFTRQSKTDFIEHRRLSFFPQRKLKNQTLESIRQTRFDPIGSGNIGNVLSTGTAPRFTALMQAQTIETQCHRHQYCPISVSSCTDQAHTEFNCPNNPLLAKQSHFIKKRQCCTKWAIFLLLAEVLLWLRYSRNVRETPV